MCSAQADVRFVPIADIRRSLICRLLDYLVGAREQRRRYSETERFRGREIDYEVKLGWKLNWQAARLGAFENLSGITPAPRCASAALAP